MAELPGAQDTVCPKCGGKLRFRSDSMRYGLTIECCEHFALDRRGSGRPIGCDHWRTLERPVRPELARPPKGDERPSAQARERERAARDPRGKRPAAKTRVRMQEILQLLPAERVHARTSAEVAALAALNEHVAVYILRQLERDRLVHSAYRPRVGTKTGRPWREYWRAA